MAGANLVIAKSPREDTTLFKFGAWLSGYCVHSNSGLILGLHPANERRRYFVTTSLIGWVHT